MKINTLEEVLQNSVIFKSVYELTEPEDTMEVGSIYKIAFTKIYQCFDLYKENKVLDALALILDITIEAVMASPANKMIRFMKWLEAEIIQCVNLMNNIPSVKDPDLEAAGVDRLSDIGEFNIYRAITKDPREWDDLGSVRFELMYIKLLSDGIDAVVQRDYNEILKNKK